MKKVLCLLMVSIMMLAMMGFTPAEQAYIKDSKAVMEWKATQGESTMDFELKMPEGEVAKYQVQMKSKGDMEELLTHIVISIKAVDVPKDAPKLPERIELYTKGSDMYLDKASAKALFKAMRGQDFPMTEEFVLLKSDTGMVMDYKTMQEMMDYFYTMDLGVDTGLEKDGNRYTLNMDSDKMIDLMDAYIKYMLRNVDKMPKQFFPMGEMPKITDEEKEAAYNEYVKMADPFIEQAKAAIKGSTLWQETIVRSDRVLSEGKLNFKVMGAEVTLKSKSKSWEVGDVNIKLPQSVKVLSVQDMADMLTIRPVETAAEATVEAKAMLSVKLDGSYMLADGTSGTMDVKHENGKLMYNTDEIKAILGENLQIDGEYVDAETLKKIGFDVQWNEETRSVQIN